MTLTLEATVPSDDAMSLDTPTRTVISRSIDPEQISTISVRTYGAQPSDSQSAIVVEFKDDTSDFTSLKDAYAIVTQLQQAHPEGLKNTFVTVTPHDSDRKAGSPKIMSVPDYLHPTM